MMHPVHIGRPIRKKPRDWKNVIVVAVLTTVAVATTWVYYRGAGDVITAAALAMGF